MHTQLEIEEMRIITLRRTEHRLLGPALISLALLLTYLLKSFLIVLDLGDTRDLSEFVPVGHSLVLLSNAYG
jgi:hypothetical protein